MKHAEHKNSFFPRKALTFTHIGVAFVCGCNNWRRKCLVQKPRTQAKNDLQGKSIVNPKERKGKKQNISNTPEKIIIQQCTAANPSILFLIFELCIMCTINKDTDYKILRNPLKWHGQQRQEIIYKSYIFRGGAHLQQWDSVLIVGLEGEGGVVCFRSGVSCRARTQLRPRPAGRLPRFRFDWTKSRPPVNTSINKLFHNQNAAKYHSGKDLHICVPTESLGNATWQSPPKKGPKRKWWRERQSHSVTINTALYTPPSLCSRVHS